MEEGAHEGRPYREGMGWGLAEGGEAFGGGDFD